MTQRPKTQLNPDSLYNRLGGEEFLKRATEALYARVLLDDELAPFFEGLNVKRIEARQRAFLAYAFAGPEIQPSVDLRSVHAPLLGKGLAHYHFDLLMRHLCDTMLELNVGENTILEALERVESTRADVMGETYTKANKEKTMLSRSVCFIYGVACYAIGMASLVYAVPWLGDFWLPVTLDSEPVSGAGIAIAINSLLIVVFSLQHSVMARPGFKAWWTKIIPAAAERSTYVALSSVAFVAMMVFWQPLGMEIWQLSGIAAVVAYVGYGLGWVLLVAATFAINHFDLFGLRQVWLNLRGIEYTQLPFTHSTLYKVSRHPIYVGWLMVVWFTPHMTISHLMLALGLTVYILIAIQYEERDLMRFHPEYSEYKRRVAMFLPLFKKSTGVRTVPEAVEV